MCFPNWFTLSPTHKSCHPESSKKYTLPRKQYKLAHRFFFTPSSMISKCSKKTRAKALPPPLPKHTPELLNLGNQMREKGQPSIASYHAYIPSSLRKHKVHCQKCLGQSLYFAWIQTSVYQGNKLVLCCSRCKAIMKRHICISPHLRCTVCGTSCTVRAARIYLQREAPEHERSVVRLGKAELWQRRAI